MNDARVSPKAPPTSRVAAYYELTKPGIAGYVMITAGVSAFVGSRASPQAALILHTMLGVGLATGGALTLNQYVERIPDGIMTRTRGRPIPSGRVEPIEAFVFGSALLIAGLVYLASTVGALPALITAASALLYHAVYTPLKTRSYVATLAGAVPGALPMMIGWTATTGTVDLGAVALFAIGYLWQLPHVLGLAWMLREDYARVGFNLIPPGGADSIANQMVVSTLLLIPVSLAPTALGITGIWYASGAVVAGVCFAAMAFRARGEMTDARARGVFLASLLYHPVLLVLMLINTIQR